MRKTAAYIIPALAVLKFALPFLLQNSAYELHRDEYLYYAQGQHLALGYLENPPLLGWLGAISGALGGSFFWIKFWPALFGALTLLLTARIARELGGNLYAQVLAALGILFSAYLRIHFLFQPNFLEVFFWTLAVYFLLRYLNGGQPRHLYLLSAAIALAWWSKYSVLFFVLALLVAILISRYRTLLMQKHFWLAFLMGVLFMLPNVYWQYAHHFPLAHHMAELRQTQLQYISKTAFLKEQVLLLFPVLFLWLGGLVWLLRTPRFRVLAFIYFGVIVLLMLGSGKGYYALGAYPMLLAAGGVWMEGMGILKSWGRYAAVALILLLALPLVPVLLPVQAPLQMAASNKKFRLEKIGLLKWEDQQNHPLQQDFADMLGWRELAQKTERFYNALPAFSKAHTLVFCSNYGVAGALQYYAASPAFRGRVFSANGTFLLWLPQPLVFKNLIFVGDADEASRAIFKHFQKATVVASVSNPLSRQYGDKILFLQNGDAVVNDLVNGVLYKMKAQFQR